MPGAKWFQMTLKQSLIIHEFFSLICFKLVLLLSGYETERSLEKNKPKLSLTCIKQIVKFVRTCPEQTRETAALSTRFQLVKYTWLPSAALLRPDRTAEPPALCLELHHPQAGWADAHGLTEKCSWSWQHWSLEHKNSGVSEPASTSRTDVAQTKVVPPLLSSQSSLN